MIIDEVNMMIFLFLVVTLIALGVFALAPSERVIGQTELDIWRNTQHAHTRRVELELKELTSRFNQFDKRVHYTITEEGKKRVHIVSPTGMALLELPRKKQKGKTKKGVSLSTTPKKTASKGKGKGKAGKKSIRVVPDKAKKESKK